MTFILYRGKNGYVGNVKQLPVEHDECVFSDDWSVFEVATSKIVGSKHDPKGWSVGASFIGKTPDDQCEYAVNATPPLDADLGGYGIIGLGPPEPAFVIEISIVPPGPGKRPCI